MAQIEYMQMGHAAGVDPVHMHMGHAGGVSELQMRMGHAPVIFSLLPCAHSENAALQRTASPHLRRTGVSSL